jgi:hypothetical protein
LIVEWAYGDSSYRKAVVVVAVLLDAENRR